MAEKTYLQPIARIFRFIILIVLIVNLLGCNLPSAGENAAATPQSYTGSGLDVIVVLMKHTLQPMCPTFQDCQPWWPIMMIQKLVPPRHTATEYEAILDARLNKYFQQVTYGQVHFNFHVLVNPDSSDGWWDAPHALWEFNKGTATYMGDAVLIASRAMGADLNNYSRLLVIQNIAVFGGQDCSVHMPTPFYPEFCEFPIDNGGIIKMNVSEVSMNETDDLMIPTIGHELGHMLGAPDEYYGKSIGTAGWDLMGNDPYRFNHFSAWTKLDRGWLSWTENTTRLCSDGSCEVTTALDPLEIKGNNALLIPYNESPNFVGLMAECRKKILGDENIYEEGVLLTTTNPYYTASQGTIVQVKSPNSNPYGVLAPGQEYYDSSRDIRITNISQPGDQACTIKASRNAPVVPDLNILQDSAQAGENFTTYMSRDIWIDNILNGFGIFQQSEPQELIWAYADGWPDKMVSYHRPLGTGDPIWQNHQNVIGFLVHNSGLATATNIKVDVYVRQPLAVTVQNTNCGAASNLTSPSLDYLPKLIGSVTISHLGPKESYRGEVVWSPETRAPAEIEVTIEDYPGESDLSNNTAYETYTTFTHNPASMENKPSEMTALQVTLSEDCTVGLPYIAMPIPDPNSASCNWIFEAEPARGVIQPGETVNFNLLAKPSEAGIPGDACSMGFGVLMPGENEFETVGGFAFQAGVVSPASISCNAPQAAAALGAPLTITGSLDPALVATIALEYIDPAGASTVQNVETGSGGDYQDGFTPSLPGPWVVQAFWQGDETHAAAESTLCRFTVADTSTPTLTVGNNTNCRQGPGTLYGALGYATAGVPIPVTGRNSDSSWYQVQLSAANLCWVAANTGTLAGDPSHLPVIAPPPLVPTITPTGIPGAPYCSQFAIMECKEFQSATCKWDDASSTCISK